MRERKVCTLCGAYLPITYELDMCPKCEEIVLFSEVKDFIRENRVTEFQLAEHFNIPLKKVKKWIKDGRIEYVLDKNQEKNISFLTCMICDTPIKSGCICPKCESLKAILENKGYTLNNEEIKNRMRYLNNK